jgi:biotin synthase-related radical SAM superfamily protein
VKRICISMITNKRSINDTKRICHLLRSSFDVPVSLLISPTILNRDDLVGFKAAGADKIGVAVDLATPELFDKFRGSGVGGPHQWDTYWGCLEDAGRLFGDGNAGPHLMVGMGETEKEMCAALQKARDIGARTHLFSFFPEENSAMGDHLPPPLDQYRRVQLAHYLIDRQIQPADKFNYNGNGQILDFGLPSDIIDMIINAGKPFQTTGCNDNDGQVACNRPFGNSRPGPDIRNYPFALNQADITRIRKQMNLFP